MNNVALYRTIWRWHFYAGLLVLPLIVTLSLTGAIYLFKPQVERWEERAWQDLPTDRPASPDAQLDAALAAFPGARFHSYRLPERPGDAALVHLALPSGDMRDVFVSPQGRVVGSLDAEWRIQTLVSRIHGQLLLGQRGSWIVELAASWAIVMIITGLYLWWPDGRGAAGILWPRTKRGSRVFLRDLHAVTGFWVAGLAMVLLLTGLPWAHVWGSAFGALRTQMGWVKGAQDWTIGGEAPPPVSHADHDHAAMMRMQAAGIPLASLSDMVANAQASRLAFPAIVVAPNPDDMAWTVRSAAQYRPHRVVIRYDMATGAQLTRENFEDMHPLDRAIGLGVAWHEGALFGWVNQLIGLLTAAMLITLSVSGFIMWRRRKPADLLGAPPMPTGRRLRRMVPVILLLAAMLPLLAASLVALLLFDRLLLPRLPALGRWLGMTPPAQPTSD